MRLGIWTPLPHTIRAEPAMEAGIHQVKTPGAEGASIFPGAWIALQRFRFNGELIVLSNPAYRYAQGRASR